MKTIHINIGRQIGAGGLEIAHILGNRLNIKVFDKELIALAAKESGLDKALFENADEANNLKMHSSFSFSSFVAAVSTGFGTNFLNASRFFNIQSDVIKKIADEQSTIFVGRCADYVLRDYTGCLNVFITSDLDARIRRIRESRRFADVETLTDERIAELLEKADKKRASYYGDFSMKKWGYSACYHLSLSSSLLGTQGCADIIEEIVKQHFI